MSTSKQQLRNTVTRLRRRISEMGHQVEALENEIRGLYMKCYRNNHTQYTDNTPALAKSWERDR